MQGIPDLTLVQIYKRALALLAPEKYLALMLAAAGVVLAGIQLAEPILFGKVVDALSKGEGAFSIIALWAALGLFGIFANVTVAIYSDRLAHRRRLAVLAESFEKAMVLPQSYHAARGSGTVIRTLVSGCSSLFWLWLGAMRDQLQFAVLAVAGRYARSAHCPVRYHPAGAHGAVYGHAHGGHPGLHRHRLHGHERLRHAQDVGRSVGGRPVRLRHFRPHRRRHRQRHSSSKLCAHRCGSGRHALADG